MKELLVDTETLINVNDSSNLRHKYVHVGDVDKENTLHEAIVKVHKNQDKQTVLDAWLLDMTWSESIIIGKFSPLSFNEHLMLEINYLLEHSEKESLLVKVIDER